MDTFYSVLLQSRWILSNLSLTKSHRQYRAEERIMRFVLPSAVSANSSTIVL